MQNETLKFPWISLFTFVVVDGPDKVDAPTFKKYDTAQLNLHAAKLELWILVAQYHICPWKVLIKASFFDFQASNFSCKPYYECFSGALKLQKEISG